MSKGPLYQDAIDLEFYREMRRMLPEQWQRRICSAEGKRYEAMAYTLAKQGKLSEARQAAQQALRSPHVIDNLVSKIKVLIYVEAYCALSIHRRKPGSP